MALHLDPCGLHGTGCVGGLADDLPGAIGQVGAVPVEEHEVGAGDGRRHHGRRRRRGRRRAVEAVAQAEQHGVVDVLDLQRGRHAGNRRSGEARDVQRLLERAEEAVLGGHGEPGERATQAEGRTGDRLVGELGAGVVDVEAAGAQIEAGTADLHPARADAGADIGHEHVGRDAEGGEVEVEQRVRHGAEIVQPPAGAGLHAVDVGAAEVGAAPASLDLEAQPVAEAVAEAAEHGPARIRGAELRPATGLVRPEIHARAAADIDAAHRLRRDLGRRQQHRGEAERGKGRAKAAHRTELTDTPARRGGAVRLRTAAPCCIAKGIAGRQPGLAFRHDRDRMVTPPGRGRGPAAASRPGGARPRPPGWPGGGPGAASAAGSPPARDGPGG